MQRVLALDIGLRKTGVAFGDTETGIPLPLPTVTHGSDEELQEALLVILQDKQVDQIVCGLPLLPSGDEGEQAAQVRDCISRLQLGEIPVQFLDERYTTPISSSDPDAEAASALLSVYLEQYMGEK